VRTKRGMKSVAPQHAEATNAAEPGTCPVPLAGRVLIACSLGLVLADALRILFA
jgi:hypothetical protein